MAGVKGRSGRRKSRKTEIDELLNTARDEDLPGLLRVLTARGKGGDITLTCPHCKGDFVGFNIPNADIESAKYMVDRFLGKAAISIDARVKAAGTMTPEDYELATREAKTEEAEILGELLSSSPLLTQGPEPSVSR